MKLIVEYKNGNKIESNAHYVHYENDCIFYTVKKDVECSVSIPVKIPLKNIKSFEVK